MIHRRALLLGLAATPALAGCTSKPRLRIGYQNGLLVVAKAHGDLDAIARVDWHAFGSGPPLIEAISVGALDLGGTGDTPPLAAASQGAPIRLVAAQPVGGAAAAILVPRTSTLTNVAELKGKRVGWLRGSSAESFVGRALDQAGLALSDVEAVNLAPDAAAVAFAGGSLDAWAVWDPYYAQAQVEQGARVLRRGRPLAASTSFIVASEALVRDQPDMVRAVLAALRRTSSWALANRGTLSGVIADASGLSPTVAARMAARQDLTLVPLTPAIVAAEQQVADALRADGQLPARIDVARLAWNGWSG